MTSFLLAAPAVAAERLNIVRMVPRGPGALLLTGGAPFPRGTVATGTQLVARMASGPPRTVQYTPVALWNDGSVRWALVDLVVQSETAGDTLQVKPGKGSLPADPAGVDEQDQEIQLSGGGLTVHIPRTGSDLISEIDVRGQPVAGPLDIQMRRNPPDAPVPATRTAAAKAQGPVRAEIELRGRIGEETDYVARLTTWASTPTLRVLFTLVGRSATPRVQLRQLALRLKTALGEPPEITLEDADGQISRVTDGLRLVQLDAQESLVGGKRGQRSAGWIDLSGPRGGVLIAGRYFWQEYPKALEAAANQLTYAVWPVEASPGLLGTGVAKTTELALYFHPVPQPPATLAATATALTHPAAIAAPPARVVRNGFLPGALNPAHPSSARFLDRLRTAARGYQRRLRTEQWFDSPSSDCSAPGTVRKGFYGMLNWGDWNFPGLRDQIHGCEAWGNLEYDLTQVLALAFASTGDPLYLRLLVPAARHYMDVDVIHYLPGRSLAQGMNHPHAPLHFSFDAGITTDLGHTWTEGLLSYHALMGDPRALEVARHIGDALVRRGVPGHRANPRQLGWPQIALAALYRSTGDQSYHDTMVSFAERALESYPPLPAAGWKMGILADGMAATHALTQDSRLREWLQRYADAVLANPERFKDIRYYAAFGYLSAISGRSVYLSEAIARLAGTRVPTHGKGLALVGRSGFRILSFAAPGAAARVGQGTAGRK